MSFNNVMFEKKDGIACIRVNRPEALNALNLDVLGELSEAVGVVDRSDDVRVLIFTGEGRAFIAGADIEEMGRMTPEEGREMIRKGQRLMKAIEELRIPVIAAINGFALGGGNELAMSCDIRIASEKAKFGQPEVNFGIIPGYGGTQRLTRLVGKGMAKKLIFSAETIDAAEALKIGLVEKVVPHDMLMDEVMKLAQTIASKAPVAVRMAKEAVNGGAEADLATGLRFEAEAFASSFATEDRVEGMKSFTEKRTAVFKGR